MEHLEAEQAAGEARAAGRTVQAKHVSAGYQKYTPAALQPKDAIQAITNIEAAGAAVDEALPIKEVPVQWSIRMIPTTALQPKDAASPT